VYLGADLSDDHPLGIVDPEIIAQRRAFDVPTDSRRRPTVLRSATVEAPLECTTCHAAHEQDARAPVGAEQFAACGTCHGEHVAGLGAHSAVSCTGCHQIHGARQRSLLFELNTEFLCARCHTSTGGAPTEWQEAHGVDEVALTVSPSHNAGSQCEECHAVHQ
jgi:predicted CXXCH cytochrome family protein